MRSAAAVVLGLLAAFVVLPAPGSSQNSSADALGLMSRYGRAHQLFQWSPTGWTSRLESLQSGIPVVWVDSLGLQMHAVLSRPRVETDPRPWIDYEATRSSGAWQATDEWLWGSQYVGYWVSSDENHAPFVPTTDSLPVSELARALEELSPTEVTEGMEVVTQGWQATLPGHVVRDFKATRQWIGSGELCPGRGEIAGVVLDDGSLQVLRSVRSSGWCPLRPLALLERAGRVFLFEQDTDTDGDTAGALYELVDGEFIAICQGGRPERCRD